MRILYVDVDSLRPDHLGCYGYHRRTSPNIDAVATEGVRFENVYASDTPCLPSRTALISGRLGVHTGVVSHGGRTADPFTDGIDRGFQSRLGQTSWPRLMREAGIRATTITTFAERHSAFHWYAGFHEAINIGRFGMETADEVSEVALDWLDRNGEDDGWFLHVNLWDPHTPYRTPKDFGDPFEAEPPPEWLTEEVRARHWQLPGPHSAQELCGFTPEGYLGSYVERFPRQPVQASSLEDVRQVFDGYDTGILYADDHIGRLLRRLEDLNVADETAIAISADHGENLGELNIYGDHHTADEITSRLPMILRWPGIGGPRVDRALHYQIDVAATILELLGIEVPETWDGNGFAGALRTGEENGRDYMVLGHGAHTVQRSVRFGDYLFIRSYHDDFHGYPDAMLFDVAADPHEQHDLTSDRPQIVREAASLLEEWQADVMAGAHGTDPIWTLLWEGGGWHGRGKLESYTERLRATGRADWAEHFERRYTRPGWEGPSQDTYAAQFIQ